MWLRCVRPEGSSGQQVGSPGKINARAIDLLQSIYPGRYIRWRDLERDTHIPIGGAVDCSCGVVVIDDMELSRLDRRVERDVTAQERDLLGVRRKLRALCV